MRAVFLPTPAAHELRRRLPRLLVGLILFGLGAAAMVAADLGLGPWDVLHQGLSRLSGVPIGTVGIAVGLVVLAAWYPLRERLGIGTLLNVLVIGAVIDLTLLVVVTPATMAARTALMLAGPPLFGLGSALYIGAGLGPGPRDGLMTGLAKRGWRIGVARTAIEVSVLVAGIALGGTAGFGTLLFAVSIGPLVHVWLPRFTLPPVASEPR